MWILYDTLVKLSASYIDMRFLLLVVVLKLIQLCCRLLNAFSDLPSEVSVQSANLSQENDICYLLQWSSHLCHLFVNVLHILLVV